jgi:SRSO17 transposase
MMARHQAAERWGVTTDLVAQLPERLVQTFGRFRTGFRTQTHNGSQHAWTYLKGLLTMPMERNFTNLERRVCDPAADGQAVQHFMSDSPWSGHTIMHQVQTEIAAHPALQAGGVLIVDESADKKAGSHSIGAARQWNGRLGKVDLSQVGVFVAFAVAGLWTWIDGEVFLPEECFAADQWALQRRLGLPSDRVFATKLELAWTMIQRAQVPYEIVLCDDLYGRSGWFRTQMTTAHLTYLADIPANTTVYLTRPTFGVPPKKPGKGRKPTRTQVCNEARALSVAQVARLTSTTWHRYQVRPIERGILADPFALRRVFVVQEDQVTEQWLVMRREAATLTSYALCNAPATTLPAQLVWWKCQRFAIEVANREAKSDLGWDELQAQKFRAWEHHVALTVLASWFIADTKLAWQHQVARDPALQEELAVVALPALTMRNVRELLKATMPLPQLSPSQATQLVVQHLLNRAHSTACRLAQQRSTENPILI